MVLDCLILFYEALRPHVHLFPLMTLCRQTLTEPAVPIHILFPISLWLRVWLRGSWFRGWYVRHALQKSFSRMRRTIPGNLGPARTFLQALQKRSRWRRVEMACGRRSPQHFRHQKKAQEGPFEAARSVGEMPGAALAVELVILGEAEETASCLTEDKEEDEFEFDHIFEEDLVWKVQDSHARHGCGLGTVHGIFDKG